MPYIQLPHFNGKYVTDETICVFRSNSMMKGKFVVLHLKVRLQNARKLCVTRPTYRTR